MRGAQIGFAASYNTRRIIPADAGSTFGRAKDKSDSEDHPRGCGEHWAGSALLVNVRGSSPRMRGAHLEILAIPTI